MESMIYIFDLTTLTETICLICFTVLLQTVEVFLDKNISLIITSQKLLQKSDAYGEMPSPASCGPSPSPLQP